VLQKQEEKQLKEQEEQDIEDAAYSGDLDKEDRDPKLN
jgi:hypothetical protein